MIITIYDYDNKETKITLPDKNIKEIYVHVLSGDETGYVRFEDDSRIDFDASDCRIVGYDDGKYFVTGKDIQKWINFKPPHYGTNSYRRQSLFDELCAW